MKLLDKLFGSGKKEIKAKNFDEDSKIYFMYIPTSSSGELDGAIVFWNNGYSPLYVEGQSEEVFFSVTFPTASYAYISVSVGAYYRADIDIVAYFFL